MMLVLGRGVGQGYRVAQATAVGIASAGLVQLPLLAFGLSEFVSSMPWLLDLIRLIGAAYLMYLGFKLLKYSNAVMKICGFAVMSIVALTSGQIGKWMSRHPKWLINQERFVGVILIATGLRLLMELGSEGRPAHS